MANFDDPWENVRRGMNDAAAYAHEASQQAGQENRFAGQQNTADTSGAHGPQGESFSLPTTRIPGPDPSFYGPARPPAGLKENVPGQYEPKVVVNGTNFSSNLAFIAHGIYVDNYSPQWLYINCVDRYIPPSSVGWAIPIYAGSQSAQITWEAPEGITQPAANTATKAHVQWVEVMIEEEAGSIVTESSSITIGTVNQGNPNAGGTLAWPVQGAGANGSATVGNPVLVGGSDGTNTRTIQTSSAGAVIANIQDSNGAALTRGQKTMSVSFPVVIASDQSAVTVQGGAASGSAVTGNPVLIGGSDGTNARSVLTDTLGRVFVNQGAPGAAGSPWPIEISDGTNVTNVIAGDSGQNSALVATPRKEVSFTTTTAQAVGSTDASNYRWVSVQVTSQGTGSSVQFQASNDNATWVSVALWDPGNSGFGNATSTSTTKFFAGPLNSRYFRLNVTGISAGTTAGVIEFLGSSVGLVPGAVQIADSNGNSLSSNTLGDALSTSSRGLTVESVGYQYNGSTVDKVRTPNIFKTATATASGDTAVWTPAGGKKFRLQRWMIQVTDNAIAASAGVLEIILRDATTGTAAAFSVFIPSSALDTSGQLANSGWVDFGNGILSSTINNVLNVNLSFALTAGEVRVIACGTEE